MCACVRLAHSNKRQPCGSVEAVIGTCEMARIWARSSRSAACATMRKRAAAAASQCMRPMGV
jgi:hypothetical protein